MAAIINGQYVPDQPSGLASFSQRIAPVVQLLFQEKMAEQRAQRDREQDYQYKVKAAGYASPAEYETAMRLQREQATRTAGFEEQTQALNLQNAQFTQPFQQATAIAPFLSGNPQQDRSLLQGVGVAGPDVEWKPPEAGLPSGWADQLSVNVPGLMGRTGVLAEALAGQRVQKEQQNLISGLLGRLGDVGDAELLGSPGVQQRLGTLLNPESIGRLQEAARSAADFKTEGQALERQRLNFQIGESANVQQRFDIQEGRRQLSASSLLAKDAIKSGGNPVALVAEIAQKSLAAADALRAMQEGVTEGNQDKTDLAERRFNAEMLRIGVDVVQQAGYTGEKPLDVLELVKTISGALNPAATPGTGTPSPGGGTETPAFQRAADLVRSGQPVPDALIAQFGPGEGEKLDALTGASTGETIVSQRREPGLMQRIRDSGTSYVELLDIQRQAPYRGEIRRLVAEEIRKRNTALGTGLGRFLNAPGQSGLPNR